MGIGNSENSETVAQESPGVDRHWMLPVAGLAITGGLAELAYSTVNILAIPAYISKGLGLGAFLGFIMGAFLLVEAVGRLGLGALSDRMGRRPLIVTGPLLSAMACVLLVHATGAFSLTAVRIFDGLGAAAFWPALFAAVGDRSPPDRRSASMGMLNVAYMVGLAFGPLMGGTVNAIFSTPERTAYTPAFYAAGVVFVLAAVTGAIFSPAGVQGRHVAAEAFPGAESASAGSMLQAAGRVWPLLLVALVTFLGIGMLIPVVELFALDRYGITQQEFGVLFVAPAVVIALLAVPLGSLGDKWPRLRSIRLGLVMAAVALAAVPMVDGRVVLALGAMVVGAGFLLAFPAWMALLTEVTAESKRGAVLGAAGMAQGAGAIVGTWAGAHVYHAQGMVLGVHPHEAPFYLASALLGVAFLLAALVVGGRSEAGAAGAS